MAAISELSLYQVRPPACLCDLLGCPPTCLCDLLCCVNFVSFRFVV